MTSPTFDFSVFERDAGAEAHLGLFKKIYDATKVEGEEDKKYLIRSTWVADGLVSSLSKALQCPYNIPTDKAPVFMHFALMIISYITGLYDDEEKPSENPNAAAAAAVVQEGALDKVFEVMTDERGIHPFYIMSGISAIHATLGALRDKELSKNFAKKVMPVIVHQVETAAEGDDKKVGVVDIYASCCNIFCRALFAQDGVVELDLFQRMGQAVFAGLIHHKHNAKVQHAGRGFLLDFFGEQAADMIDHVEMHIREECVCTNCTSTADAA